MRASQPNSVSELDPPPPSLLGRDEELARLYGIVEELADHGGALVVRGEAGIGKTAMLAAASKRASSKQQQETRSRSRSSRSQRAGSSSNRRPGSRRFR